MKTKLTPIAAAAAVVLAGAMAPAFAQSAPAAADAASAPDSAGVQHVEVTGIRASLRQSLTQKRNSDSIVEVVTSEDVGKMPDKNVADSLQRLPGVYTATAGGTEGGFGENDRVSVRGAPSALTLTTLNGHTVSTGDWYAANITGGGRSVSYSLLPSEIIDSVIVHKQPEADFIEGGAVGTVDIKTRHPLDFKNPLTLNGSAEAVYSQNSKRTDPQMSGLVSWHNAANTFGVLVQAFYEQRHLRRDGQEFLWWDTIEDLWGKNTDVLAAHPDLANKYISGLTGSVEFLQERKRTGGIVDVELKPISRLTLDLNAFYTKLDAVNENHNYMLDTFNPITSIGLSPSSYTISGNTVTSIAFPATCPAGYDCSGTSTAVQDIAVRPQSGSNSQFYNLDGKYELSDAWTLDGKLGHTSGYGRTHDIGFEVWSPYSGGGYTTHGLSSTADMSVPGSDKFSIGGVSNTIGGWASYVNADDKENYGQIDATFKPQSDLFSEFKFGARYSDHKRNLTDVPGTVSSAGSDPANAPLDQVTNFPSDFGDGLPGGLLKGAWTIPGSAVTGWANQYITFSGHTPQSEFKLDEPVYALYGMTRFDNGSGLRGNVGVRVVNTEEAVTNNVLQADKSYLPVTITNKYVDVLPNLNLAYDLTRNLVGRFGASRTMSRPEFGQLAGLNLLDIQMTGSGGNPNLKPIRSTNYDLDLEYYFGESKKSMVSGGVYFMDFDTYVTFGSFDQVFYNQSQKAFTTYHMSAPLNTTAYLKGIELNYVGDIGYGFGVQANYTYADGRETGHAPGSSCATTGDCNMVGTSKNAYNLGAYYENDLFSARVVWNHRSAFLNGLDRHSAIYQDGVGTLGASLDFNVTKNISLTFEGKDLNNPLLKSYATTPDQPRAFYKNGAQYYFGVRASL